MSFSDDINKCMSSSGLATPGSAFDSLSDALEFLDELHTSWENSGGDEETTLGVLITLGAFTGVDEAAAGTAAVVAAGAAAITVGAYLTACFACVVSVAGSAIWDEISSPVVTQDWIRAQLKAQAEAQNVPNPADALPPDDPFS